MESNQTLDNAFNEESSTALKISYNSTYFLRETAKWGKFLSILGFCFIGIIVLVGLFAGSIFSKLGNQLPFPGFVIGIFYIIIAVIYFFPIYYLFKFSTHTKKALNETSNTDLESALENLKSHYKYISILMIIVLGFYVLVGGIAFLTALFSGL